MQITVTCEPKLQLVLRNGSLIIFRPHGLLCISAFLCFMAVDERLRYGEFRVAIHSTLYHSIFLGFFLQKMGAIEATRESIKHHLKLERNVVLCHGGVQEQCMFGCDKTFIHRRNSNALDIAIECNRPTLLAVANGEDRIFEPCSTSFGATRRALSSWLRFPVFFPIVDVHLCQGVNLVLSNQTF